TDFGYVPHNMTWNNKYVLELWGDCAAYAGYCFDSMVPMTNSPTDGVWDGLEAYFGNLPDGFTYERFRNGQNPDSEDLTFAPGWWYGVNYGAVAVSGASFIEVRGFTVRNAWKAVAITDGASDNVIAQNTLIGGVDTVLIYADGGRNQIRQNEITLDYVYPRFGDPTDPITHYPSQVWNYFK